MDCLIIGGTGTISEGIAFEAIRKGHDVTVLNRGTNNSRIPQGAKALHGNIDDESQIKRLLDGKNYDIIVDPITYNADQLRNRLDLLSKYCDQYYFISSAAVYGSGEEIQSEESEKKPSWDYGVNKLECENFLTNGNTRYTIIRPSITYGDIRIPIPVACRTNPWTVIDRIKKNKPLVCFKYSGEHKTIHNIMNIRDFSVYVVGLFGNSNSVNNDYIVCSDFTYTWENTYSALYNTLGMKEHIYEVDRDIFKFMNPTLFDDIQYDKDAKGVSFSNLKVKTDTGISLEEISLEEGIRSLVKYLGENYKDRPLEEEYNKMTDAILLYGVRKQDTFLTDYLNGLGSSYKSELKTIWRKRKIKCKIKDSFIYKLLRG